MATAFRSDAETTNGTAGTSVTVSAPAGLVDTGTDRDYLIAFIAATGAPTITPPAGWTLVTSAVDATNAVTMWAYRKLADSEPASWTWTLGTSQRNWGWVGAYSGIDPTTPVGASGTDLTLTSSTILNPSAALNAYGHGVGASAAVRTASGAATTWTHSSTERADLSTNEGAGTDISGVVGDTAYSGSSAATYAPDMTASQTQTAGVGIALTLNAYFFPYGGGVNDAGLTLEAAFDVDPDSVQSGWTWTDISTYVHEPAKIVLTHGKANRATVADPSRMTLTLKNLDGEFTSPAGTYFGKLIENLPLRVKVSGFGKSSTGYHRGTFFLASATPRWDQSTNFSVVDVVAQGRLRRMQQHNVPLRSAAYRSISNFDGFAADMVPTAYWPLEDSSGAQSAASALPFGRPAFTTGVTFGADDTFDGSAPLPTLSSSSLIRGRVPSYAATGQWAVMFVMKIPSEPAGTTTLCEMFTDGSAAKWAIELAVGTSALHIRAYDSDGTSILNDSVTVTESDFYANEIQFALTVTQNGSNVDYQLWGGVGKSGTLASRTHGNISQVQVRGSAGLDGASIGHMPVFTDANFDGVNDPILLTTAVVEGHAGEEPWARVQRLCIEEGIPYRADATGSTWLTMGPQGVDTLVNLLRECETVEGSVLGDSGTAVAGDTGAIWLPARDDRYNAATVLTLGAGQIQGLVPRVDDQDLTNDVVASRPGGSSARDVDQTSIDTKGRYVDQVNANIEGDGLLLDIASWHVNLGTAPPRLPAVSWNLRKSTTLAEQWLDCALFSRVDITSTPSQYPQDTIRTFLEGYTEVLSSDTWTVAAYLSSAEPYTVGVYAADAETPDPDEPKRYSPYNSTVAAGLVLPGASGDYASTPDHASLDITGDIDIRVEATGDWNSGGIPVLAAKYNNTGNQRSWRFYSDTGGTLSLRWSTDGTTLLTATSTAAVSPDYTDRLAVRVTMDVDDGAGNHVVNFYTSDSIDGTWTQLGSTVTTAGTTSIFASTSELEVGSYGSGTTDRWTGVIHAMELRDGIDGTLVADPDFDAQASATASFADSSGHTWTVNGSAALAGTFAAGTDTALWVIDGTGGNDPWSTTAAFPFDVLLHPSSIQAGVRLRVTAIDAAISTVQKLTVTQTPVNNVTRTVPVGWVVDLWTPAKYAL